MSHIEKFHQVVLYGNKEQLVEVLIGFWKDREKQGIKKLMHTTWPELATILDALESLDQVT